MSFHNCCHFKQKKPIHTRLAALATLLLFWLLPAAVLPEITKEIPIATIHCRHTPYGVPLGTPASNDLVFREIYALSSNDTTKFADWVAYRLDRDTVTARGVGTSRHYRSDPWIRDSETLEPSDYKGAHAILRTDRGHMAPLASFRGTPFWHETNYLSNITPQRSALNRGAWKKLETIVRDTAAGGSILHIVCGTLYEGVSQKLPGADESHRIPSGYWKVVLHDGGENGEDQIRTASFILPQETGKSASLSAHTVSIDEIERRSGLDLFWRLPDSVETRMEKAISFEWLLAPGRM